MADNSALGIANPVQQKETNKNQPGNLKPGAWGWWEEEPEEQSIETEQSLAPQTFEKAFEQDPVYKTDPTQLPTEDTAYKDPGTGWAAVDTLTIKADGGVFLAEGKLDLREPANIPPQKEIGEPDLAVFNQAFAAESPDKLNPDVPTNSTESIFSKPTAIVGEALGAAGNLFAGAAKTVEKTIPGAAKDVKNAFAELGSQVVGTPKQEEVKPQTPEEKQKKAEEAAAKRRAIALIDQASAAADQMNNKRAFEDAVRVAGDAANMSRSEQNNLLNLQENFNPDRILSKADSEALRIALKKQQLAAEAAKKAETISSGHGKASTKMRLDMQEGNSPVANQIMTAG
ncbi:MAG: hypothetical protein M1607_04045 [Patescibacteria group bacterium]|nr:hypothetical protein [Patescibacteria group bacterium]